MTTSVLAASRSGHPGLDSLHAFALGQLDEDDLRTVSEHLAACEVCRRQVEAVPPDGLVSLLRGQRADSSLNVPVRVQPGFEILEEIGRGGMGVVFKARQIGLGRIVALKQLKGMDLAGAQEMSRFHAEAAAMARVIHPHVVQVFEAGDLEGRPYIACEYVAGGGLDRLLSGRPIPVSSACRLVAALARGVQAAHDQAVVHRDLKPSNVLLARDTASPLSPDNEKFWSQVTPKIADFGLAKQLDCADGRTQTGAVLGTPEYMAPEQAGGMVEAVGPQTDVYSLGVILYELLTGRRPFQGANVMEVLDLVRGVDPIPPARWRTTLSRDLDVICLKCLEKSPARRYATAAALADDLDRFLARRPILARPPTPIERLIKWAARNRARTAALVLAAASLVFLVGGTLWHNRRLRVEADRASAAEASALARVRQGYESLDQLFREIAFDSPDTPEWREMDRRFKDESLKYYYNALAGADESSPQVRLTKAMLLAYAASIQATLLRVSAAGRDLDEADRLLDSLRDRPELAQEVSGHEALCSLTRGRLADISGQPNDAERHFRDSVLRLTALDEARVPFPRLPQRLATAQESWGGILLVLDRRPEAIEVYRTAIASRERCQRDDPQDAMNRVALSADWVRMFYLLPRTAGVPPRDEGEDVLNQAEAALREPPDITGLLDVRGGLADVCAMRGMLAYECGDVPSSLASYDESLDHLAKARERFPRDAMLRSKSHMYCRMRAWVLCRTGRGAESFPDWDNAVRYADGEELGFCRSERALERALLGEDQAACAEADELSAEEGLPPRTALHLARVYSRVLESLERRPESPSAEQRPTLPGAAGTADEETAARCRNLEDRGLDCLRRAEPFLLAAAGRIEDLEVDPHLAALRKLDAFRAWQAELSPQAP